MFCQKGLKRKKMFLAFGAVFLPGGMLEARQKKVGSFEIKKFLFGRIIKFLL